MSHLIPDRRGHPVARQPMNCWDLFFTSIQVCVTAAKSIADLWFSSFKQLRLCTLAFLAAFFMTSRFKFVIFNNVNRALWVVNTVQTIKPPPQSRRSLNKICVWVNFWTENVYSCELHSATLFMRPHSCSIITHIPSFSPASKQTEPQSKSNMVTYAFVQMQLSQLLELIKPQ